MRKSDAATSGSRCGPRAPTGRTASAMASLTAMAVTHSSTLGYSQVKSRTKIHNSNTQRTHTMSTESHILDGIPQCEATPLELDLTAHEAGLQLSRALRVYHKAASRPRKAQCWAFVQCELWNARQNAVRSGVLVRGSNDHAFVSGRYNDATNKLEIARRMEQLGHADARV